MIGSEVLGMDTTIRVGTKISSAGGGVFIPFPHPALIPVVDKSLSLIPVEKPLVQPVRAKPKERTLFVEDAKLKARATETLRKSVNYMVDFGADPFPALQNEPSPSDIGGLISQVNSLKIDELKPKAFVSDKLVTYVSGSVFPMAKLGSDGTRAAEIVLKQCKIIDHDCSIAQENGDFFTADPVVDAARETVVSLKIQKQAVKKRIRSEVTAEYKSLKKGIKGSLDFRAEVKRRLLEDTEARQIALKEAIYTQIVKKRRNERIKVQRDWLLENDPDLVLPDKNRVSSSTDTLYQTQKLLKETEGELRALEKKTRADIVAGIKKGNAIKPLGQRVKIRGNSEIDRMMHDRMTQNAHVMELAARGVSQLQLMQQIKADRKKINRQRTETQFRATRMAQHQDAIIEQLGLRESYRFPQALEAARLKEKNRLLQEELRWEEMVRDSLAIRTAESSQKLGGMHRAEYRYTQSSSDGKIRFENKETEKQISDLAHKTAEYYRTSGKILSGSLTRSELIALKDKASAKVIENHDQSDVQVLENRRAVTAIEIALQSSSSRRHENIRQRLVKFIRVAKRDPRAIKDSLLGILRNRKVQVAAVSSLNLAGMGLSGSQNINRPDSIVVSVPSNYWIGEKLGEMMPPQTAMTDMIETTPYTPLSSADFSVETIKEPIRLSAESQDGIVISTDAIKMTAATEEKKGAATEVALPISTLPAVPSPDTKAPVAPYGKETRIWRNPNALAVPYLDKDPTVGIGDLNSPDMLDPIIRDIGPRVIRLSTSGMGLDYIKANWQATLDKVKSANSKGLEPRLVLVDFRLPSLDEFQDFLDTNFVNLPADQLPKAITFGNELGIRNPDGAPKYFDITHESISDPINGIPAYQAKLYNAVKEARARTGKKIEFTVSSMGWNYWQVPGNMEKYIDALQKAGVDLHDPDVTFDLHTYAAIEAPFPYDENGPQRVIDYRNLLIEKFRVKDPKITIGELWFGDDYSQDQLWRIIKYFKDDLGVWNLILLPHAGSF